MTELPTVDPGFSTEAMTRVWSPAARVAAMCRVETGLARAGERVGVVPAGTADRIAVACERGVEDPAGLLADGWEAGTPVLPLLSLLRDRLDDDAAAWLHHGATTQDVVDTATMLQARDGLQLLRGSLAALGADLRGLAVEHRDTPTPAWTFLQPAVPTTVGRRVAGWLAPVAAHHRDLRHLDDDLPVQLGGPTGTLADLGDDALAVVDELARELGLASPRLPWHADRTIVDRLVGALARVARTVATIGTDLALLAHREQVHMRAGGSSSMPGKRNPVDATRAVAAARAALGVATVVTAGPAHELERGVGGWHAEWFAVPVTFQTVAAALDAAGRAVDTLEVVAPGEGEGATPAAAAFVDRAVADADQELGR